MSSIKKHQCPSCGGSLIIDNDKQMYHCSFCGSTYDYEYFREDETLRMGETYLERGEFSAAADAYRFMLNKDPHDFLALRGLMLAAAQLNSMSDLIRKDKSRDFSFDAALADEAVEGASEEDKEYFKDLRKIFSDMKELSEINGEIDSLGRERRGSGEAIRSNEVELNDCYIEKDRYGKKISPLRSFIFNWVFYAAFVTITSPLVIVGLKYNEISAAAFTFIALYILIPVLNLTVVFPMIRKKAALDRSIEELSAKSNSAGDTMKILDEKAEKLGAAIKTACHDFVKKDTLIMRKVIK